VAFEVRRGHVIKHQHAILEMPLGQAVLDTRLPGKEPIQRLIGFAVPDMAKTQLIAQARRRRLLIHRTHKAQLRAWRDQPVDHHRYNEIAIATGFGILRRAEDQTVERNLADHPQHRRDMTVRQRTLDRQLLRLTAEQCSALEQRLQGLDYVPRQLAQIGQGPLLRPSMPVAIGLPQQNRRRRIAIRHDVDEHRGIESQLD
jgi:hypothetical protein